MNINWLKYRKNLRGRDPLGVQAINIHLYSLLVPGITNVTDRLRYYSFFPWVLKLYKDENIKLDFVPFLRRAEFLFSVITTYHHINEPSWSGHMVGTMVMGQATSELTVNKKIVLSKYTSLEESNQRYFKNRLGGFGQYYLGVLIANGILDRKGNLEFALYPRGLELANAFVSGNSKDTFITCVLNDKVTAKELDIMKDDLCACNLKRNSSEYKLLSEFLKGQDDPYVRESTYKRRDSLALMFLLLEQTEKTTDYWELLNALYYGVSDNNKKIKIPAGLTETATLWKYYVQHEFFSMALLSLFVSAQHLLDDNGLVNSEIGARLWERYLLNCNPDELQASLKPCLIKLKKNPTLSEFIGYLDSVYAIDKAWDKDALSEISISKFLDNKQFPPDSLLVGGLVLLSLVIRAIKDEQGEPQGINFKGIFSQYPINLSKLRKDYNDRWHKMKIFEVVHELVMEYILNRHIEVAVRKLYTEGLATFRFLREDNIYRHSEIEYDYVGNTSPRLRESLQMMADLKIVNEAKEGFSIIDKDIGTKYFHEVISGA
ncbi:MAG: hypothetical protein WC723_05110 [Candidatus Omnitrophota bacterium]